jgi:hypothetical protein
MIKGGFGRKLDAVQITLYKTDWIEIVTRDRAEKRSKSAGEARTERERVGKLVDELEELKIQKDLSGIVFLLNRIGNIKLRDQYIEELLSDEQSDTGSKIYFRQMQGRLDLLDPTEVEAHLRSLRSLKDWSGLGRALVQLGKKSEAAGYYARYVFEALRDGRTFSAAYYFKEMSEDSIDRALFEKAYNESREKGDVWWEFRSLQELELHDEIDALLKREGVQNMQELLDITIEKEAGNANRKLRPKRLRRTGR